MGRERRPGCNFDLREGAGPEGLRPDGLERQEDPTGCEYLTLAWPSEYWCPADPERQVDGRRSRDGVQQRRRGDPLPVPGRDLPEPLPVKGDGGVVGLRVRVAEIEEEPLAAAGDEDVQGARRARAFVAELVPEPLGQADERPGRRRERPAVAPEGDLAF